MFFFVDDPREKDWQFLIKTLPRDLYNMLSAGVNGQDGDDVDVHNEVDVDAFQQGEMQEQCFTSDSNVANLVLSTDTFVIERDSKVVEMVRKFMEEYKADYDFINDGEIEQFDDISSEEKEEEFDSDT